MPVAAGVFGLLCATVATATGPLQQTTGFWNPYGHTVNSVVAISTPGGRPGVFWLGTGTIIDKRLDSKNPKIGWLCILTANHNVDPFDPGVVNGGGFSGPSTVIIGSDASNPVEGPYGDAENIVRLGQRPVDQGGLGGVDIAVIGVRVPADSPAFTLMTPATMLAVDPDRLVSNSTMFSQIGFGSTGEFVADGMQQVEAPPLRRFQSNRFASISQVTGYYAYNAIGWFMDNAMGNAVHAEGLSFPGDSGGPYLVSQEVFTDVPAFQRHFMVTDLPDWPGGLMPFFSNSIVAVHTRGSSGGAPGGFNQYGFSWGEGVPLLPGYVDWIQQQCQLIPTPAGVVLLLVVAVGTRRRRSG